jgi:hypothetical protein
MKDLYTIFQEAEKNNRIYSDEDAEDVGMPFHKVLEIAEQENEDSADDE